MWEDIIILNLNEININGPYITNIDNKNTGEIFVYNDGSFYDADGTGPWTQEQIITFQNQINVLNKYFGENYCYVTPYIEERIKKKYEFFYGVE